MLVTKRRVVSSSTRTARQFSRAFVGVMLACAQLKQSLLLTKKAFRSLGVEISRQSNETCSVVLQ